MNRLKYKFQPPRKSLSPKRLVRSPAFRKKFEDGMPRINQKVIPYHNLYEIEITNKKLAEQFGYNFWGCIIPEKRKFKTKQSAQLQNRKIQTRGQTIFKTYMKRRPSLTLTPRSFDFEKQQMHSQQNKMNQTISHFRPQKQQQIKINTENKTIQLQSNDNFMVTQEQIASIHKKSLYQMSPRELEISIEWKKRFLEIFQKKMKEAQKFQYNFKPYKI